MKVLIFLAIIAILSILSNCKESVSEDISSAMDKMKVKAKQLHKKFDANGDGSVSLEEFKQGIKEGLGFGDDQSLPYASKIYQKYLSPQNEKRNSFSEQDFEEIFNEFKEKKKAEGKVLLNDMKSKKDSIVKETKQKANQIYDKFDEDKNGHVSFEELKKGLKEKLFGEEEDRDENSLNDYAKELYEKYVKSDKEDNESFTKQDFYKIFQDKNDKTLLEKAKQKASEIQKDLDVNGDGQISLQEIKKGVAQGFGIDYEIDTNEQTIKQKASGLYEKYIKPRGENLWFTLEDIADIIAEKWRAGKQIAKEKLEQGKQILGEKLEQGKQMAKQKWEEGRQIAGEKLSQGLQIAKEKWQEGKQIIGEKLEQGKQIIGEKLQKGKQIIGEKLEQGKQIIGEKLEQGKQIIGEKLEQGKQIVGEKLQKGKQIAGEKLQQGLEIAKEKWQEGKQIIGEKLSLGKQVLGEKLKKGKQIIGQKLQQGKEAASEIVQDIKESVSEKFAEKIDEGSELFQGLKGKANEIYEKVDINQDNSISLGEFKQSVKDIFGLNGESEDSEEGQSFIDCIKELYQRHLESDWKDQLRLTKDDFVKLMYRWRKQCPAERPEFEFRQKEL